MMDDYLSDTFHPIRAYYPINLIWSGFNPILDNVINGKISNACNKSGYVTIDLLSKNES